MLTVCEMMRVKIKRTNYSPDFAALATLSAQAQRGIVIYFFSFPLSAKGGGWRAQRSRVSQICRR